MKQCPNCHTLFSDQEQFCPVCGTWVGAQYNKNDQFSYPGSKKKSRSKIILKTVLGCFAVIAAGTLSYVGAVHFFFRRMNRLTIRMPKPSMQQSVTFRIRTTPRPETVFKKP